MVVPELTREVEIPTGVEVKLEDQGLTVTGPKGTLSNRMGVKDIQVQIVDDKVILSTRFPPTRRVAVFGMYASITRNMIDGVTKGFRSRLKIISSHFPITTEVREGVVLINNFLGERHPRRAKVYQGVDVQVEGEFVVVSGLDKEAVAQTSANIEQATVVRKRDRRVFQDGIYRVDKTSPVEE
jgi:large subunit ribosomal protein L6